VEFLALGTGRGGDRRGNSSGIGTTGAGRLLRQWGGRGARGGGGRPDRLGGWCRPRAEPAGRGAAQGTPTAIVHERFDDLSAAEGSAVLAFLEAFRDEHGADFPFGELDVAINRHWSAFRTPPGEDST
jgi:hypothetical protein